MYKSTVVPLCIQNKSQEKTDREHAGDDNAIHLIVSFPTRDIAELQVESTVHHKPSDLVQFRARSNQQENKKKYKTQKGRETIMNEKREQAVPVAPM